MATLKAARTSQYPLVSEFTFEIGDTMLTTSGVSNDFGAVDLAGVFDIINLPPGSIVVGGEVITETAFDTAGFDIKVGHSDDDDEYLTSTDRAGAGRTELVPTGYRNTGGLNLRLTYASDDVCTAGKMTVRVHYIVEDRANEVQPV